jgi:hypothetical protein
MQQQDQQSGFAGMYAPQYGAFSPMAGGMAMSGGMQGYGGGQMAQGYGMASPAQSNYQGLDPAMSYYNDAGQLSYEQASQMQNQMVDGRTGYMQNISDLPQNQGLQAPRGPNGEPAPASYFADSVNYSSPASSIVNQQAQQAAPNYQVPQVQQQQPMAGYGGYAQQPMQHNTYGVQQKSSRQGPQRLY